MCLLCRGEKLFYIIDFTFIVLVFSLLFVVISALLIELLKYSLESLCSMFSASEFVVIDLILIAEHESLLLFINDD